MSFLATFPEVSSFLGNIHIRQCLSTHSVTIYFKDWNLWHDSTQQVEISDSLIHFIEPGSAIVGVKIFSDGGES